MKPSAARHDAVLPPPLFAYPERLVPPTGPLDRAVAAASGGLARFGARARARRLAAILPDIARLGPAVAALDDAALRAEARKAGIALRRAGDRPAAALPRLLATLREAAARSLGQRAFDVQLVGAHALLDGQVAEMATGEGKTLTAAIAAAAAALGGTPVHVVTVNDYLARRDADHARPLFDLLDLTVGVVVGGMPPEARRAAYRCDATWCTNKDLAFDYMRDRLALGRRLGPVMRRAVALAGGATAEPLLRGLHFAILDEADSVLVDEARTPLILSGATPAARDPATFDALLRCAGGLEPGADYRLDEAERRAELTARGRDRTGAAPGLPEEAEEREALLADALVALHLLRRDEHYILRDGKVELVDEHTGRTMPDRSWTEGLHELVERKEGLELSPRRTTLARMTYQRFFRRYRRLAGMTGTAREAAGELRRVYGLKVAAIPTNRPDRKRFLSDQGHASAEAKWSAIVAQVAAWHAEGKPVLLGTRTVAASEEASRRLTEAGVPHAVLNAAQDAEEAAVVARAGLRGAVTVATNMAGRGTDIRLAPGVAELGGLHVVITERHDSGRIDRQLAGRAGRQGEPGLVQAHVSPDDALPLSQLPLLRLVLPAVPLVRLAQRRAEALHARMRADLLRSEDWLGDALAFSGEAE